MDCIFCKIIDGEIPSMTIYEDDLVKAFLDVNPEANGHTLIVPKKHFTNICDIDNDTLTHINKVARNLYNLLKEKLNCDGVTVLQYNDYGQAIKHYHMHLIPRYKNDNAMLVFNKEIVKNKKDPKDIFEIITKK